MNLSLKRLTPVLLVCLMLLVPVCAGATMTAIDVLDRALKEKFGDGFRVAVEINTFKGNRPLAHYSLWLMGRADPKGAAFFLDFDEPKDSKGMRFLFFLDPVKKPVGYMYLPSTDKTMPLDMEKSEAEVGATGLTMLDLQGFMPQKAENAEIVAEEAVEGIESYKIRIPLPKTGGERLVWISKKDYFLVKARELSKDGKTIRTMKVTELFEAQSGEKLPRAEEVHIPGKNITIKIRQEHAVFGIAIPDEVLDPKQFGTFKWRI